MAGTAGRHTGNTATLAWPSNAAGGTPTHASGQPVHTGGKATATASPPAPPAAAAAPATAPRKPLAAIAGGVAAVVLAVVAWQWLKPGDEGTGSTAGAGAASAAGNGSTSVATVGGTGAQAQQTAASQAAGAEGAASAIPVATTHTPVPGLKCSAEQADWPCVLDGLSRLTTSGSTVQVKVLPERARIGDSFSLDITPSSDGRLTVLGVNDRADGKLVLVFPNAADSSDRLHAGHALKLPRRPHWDLVAQAPTGRSYMVAVVTPAGLKTPPALAAGLSLQDAVAAFAAKRPLSLLGVADCTPGGPECPKSLAIRSADFIIE
jgi:hypothetical protein